MKKASLYREVYCVCFTVKYRDENDAIRSISSMKIMEKTDSNTVKKLCIQIKKECALGNIKAVAVKMNNIFALPVKTSF